MSQKSTNSVKQTPSPIKPLPEETSKRFVPSSLMFSYFNDSHCYLNRKYSENNAIDFNHSNNFVRKDSLCVNNEETKDNEEDDMVNSEENESEDEEYGQLNANGVYNQQYINQDSNSKLPLFRFNLNQQFNLMTLNQIQQQQRPRFNSGNFTMLPNTFNFQPPYQVELPKKGGWVCSQCNNYNYNTRDIRFLQRYKLKIKRCRLEKKFSIILAIINYAINFNGFFIIFTWNTNRKKIALL